MERKEACDKLGKIFLRMGRRMDPFETYRMIVDLTINQEWQEIATEKMKKELNKQKEKLEEFLKGSDGDGRTEEDQKKTVKRRNQKILQQHPEIKEQLAMAKADIYFFGKRKYLADTDVSQ